MSSLKVTPTEQKQAAYRVVVVLTIQVKSMTTNMNTFINFQHQILTIGRCSGCTIFLLLYDLSLPFIFFKYDNSFSFLP